MILESLRAEFATQPVNPACPKLGRYLMASMGSLPDEVLRILFLDCAHRLIADEQLQKGSVRHLELYPRTIFRRAMEHGATGVILVHNHPSGDPTPSDHDIRVTRRLVDVGRSLDIEIVDHIVVTSTRIGRVGTFGSIPADAPMVCTHVLSDNLVSGASGKPNNRALALENARREYRRRQVRRTMRDLADIFEKNDPGESSLYGEPGWEALIVLFIHHCEGKKIATVALASAALSPMTTVLRWINRLCDAGLTIKVPDPTDGRRHFVELTPFTLSHLEAYFSAVEG